MPHLATSVALAALIAVGAAACSSGPRALPRPDGAVFRLNPDRWGETVNDVRERQAPPPLASQEARR